MADWTVDPYMDINGLDYLYISLGAGVQSTAVYLMSSLGVVHRADVAIFADTQDEPQWVYDHLDQLRSWADENDGIPIKTTTYGKLSAHVIERHTGERSRFASLPVWTKGADGRAAPLRRQCTREYKITPIEKKVRELLGYKPRQRIREGVGCMLGISVDEASRAKASRTGWIRNLYPLLSQNMSRASCARFIKKTGLPVPKKSSCVFCPYHSDSFWRMLKNDHPDEWERAVEFDRAVRDMTESGMENPVFLHRSLKPLEDVSFEKQDDPQLDLFNLECEGMCGV